MRAHAQIPARIKFLLVVNPAADGVEGVQPTDISVNAFTVDSLPTTSVTGLPTNGTFFTDLDISGAPGYEVVDLGPGDLYRDLGKQLTIIDPTTKAHLASFRLARLQNNAAAEGIGGGPNTWIKVWSASGLGVAVARTG